MNLHLKRLRYLESGIYGNLTGDGLNLYTLEHAFESKREEAYTNGVYLPKVPKGKYVCTRGTHTLEHGTPFETFEIQSVANHTGILFHIGNWNKDSDGCILLGQEIDIPHNMLLNSAIAFHKFMDMQSGLLTFELTIE